MAAAPPQTRRLRIIAQDPAVTHKGRILTTEVEIPAEELGEGPWGYRVHVIDYDGSARLLYPPLVANRPKRGGFTDPFRKRSDLSLLENPTFHAQNVYAIVMRILARFEYALGRRVSWQFGGHQLKVAPHAFADANAFYSRDDEALLFGYFRGGDGSTIFSCLSHDVVAHEATHALLDGLRKGYLAPSSPDQAAFHEGFADVVAILSVFALPDVVNVLVDRAAGMPSGDAFDPVKVKAGALSVEFLKGSVLFGLAEEMGRELSAVRGRALRHSAKIEPSPLYMTLEEFLEPHRRGEILVATMMDAFVRVWTRRVQSLAIEKVEFLSRERVAEEGARAADYLLTMTIRALDYCPPVHIEFADFLSALLTADNEIRPDDSTFHFRDELRASFKSFGILPSALTKRNPSGHWLPPELRKGKLAYSRTRFDSLSHSPDEVFRFIWENREALGLYDRVYTRVLSVRPCLRIGPDGFFLRETVAEYEQKVELKKTELGRVRCTGARHDQRNRIKPPARMPDETKVILSGGGTLIFDEYGQLKFHINNRLNDAERQSRRLEHLWDYGYFSQGRKSLWRDFATTHRLRSVDGTESAREGWL